MRCSGVGGVSCPRHTTTPSSLPALWCQTEEEEERWERCEDGGDKKEEGIKKHAVCEVETKASERVSEGGRGERKEESFELIVSLLSESLENEPRSPGRRQPPHVVKTSRCNVKVSTGVK